MSKNKNKPAATGLAAAFANLGGISDMLSADFTPAAETAPAGAMRLPLDKVHPDPDQPRRTFSEEELDELASSIAAQGVIQAIAVRPHPEIPDEWMIVAGERRWRASQLAGQEDIPALIDDRPPGKRLLAQITENVQRDDLTPLDAVLGYGRLHNDFGMKATEIAREVGKSKQVIGEYLAVLDMPEQYRQALEDRAVRDVSALNALWRMREKHPQQVAALLASATAEKPITRALVRTLADGGADKPSAESTAAVLSGTPANAAPEAPTTNGVERGATAERGGKEPATTSREQAGQGRAERQPAAAQLPVGIRVRYDGSDYWLRYDTQRSEGDRVLVLLASDSGRTLYAPLDELVITNIQTRD